jgi:hypothetical protein
MTANYASAVGPLGRTIRGGLAVVFLGWVAASLPTFSTPVLLAAGGTAVGLVVVYALVHLAMVRWFRDLHSGIGAAVAIVPSAAVFLLGGPVGQLGALVFWGVSLAIASLRAAPGCEVMVVPGMFLGEHVHLPCAFLSPIDRVEERLSNFR